jgi:DNA polymerase-3 subunit chi
MTEVLFYHLQNAPLEQVLPQLLEVSLKREWRVVIKAGNADRLEDLNAHLWSYRADGFLPHGTAEDELIEAQPIYLTLTDENPNEAQVLFLVYGATPTEIQSYNRCVLLFDGRDEEALTAARSQWKALKAEGHDATYWQQSAEGKWQKKA